MTRGLLNSSTTGHSWIARVVYVLLSLAIASSVGYGVATLADSPSSSRAPRTTPPTTACPGPIRLTARTGGAAAGTAYVTVVVTNKGSEPCVLLGYATVRFLGVTVPSGPTSAPRLAITFTPSGGPAARVVFGPGSSGEFLLVFAEVPVNGSPLCSQVSGLVVMLPGSSTKLFVSVSMLICGKAVRIEPLSALDSERP